MLAEGHQSLEIARFKTFARDAMTEKDPADDSAPGVKGDNDFRGEGVEGAAHDRALGRLHVRDVRARDEVGVQFEPADQRVALAAFYIVGLGQAAQSCPQPVAVALPDL